MKLAVLGSTNGTDLVPIVTAINSGELLASIEVIVSNNESSGILRKARGYCIENHFICHKNKKRGVFDFEISQILENKEVDLILLIGFMRILSSEFVERWHRKIINVHPSLLPKYAGGMNSDVHESVLAAGDKESGCTIHLVTKDVDCGPILLQKSCPVYENDSVESLRERVQKLEGESFIEVINNWRNYE